MSRHSVVMGLLVGLAVIAICGIESSGSGLGGLLRSTVMAASDALHQGLPARDASWYF